MNYLRDIKFLLGKDSKSIWLMVVLFFLVSLLEILGLGIVAPYIAIIVEPSSIIDLLENSKVFIILVHFLGSEINAVQVINLLSVSLVLVFIIKAILGIFINKIILSFCFNQGAKIRTRLIHYYLNRPFEDNFSENSSDYIHNISSLAVQYSNVVLQSLMRIASEGIVIFVIVTTLIFINSVAIIVLLSLLFVLGVSYDLIFKGKYHNLGKLVNNHSSNLIKSIKESISGIKEVKVMGKIPFFENKIQEESFAYARYSAQMQTIATVPRYLLDMILIFFIVILVILSSSAGKNISSEFISTVGIFAVAALRLIPSINQVINGITQIRIGKDSINRIAVDLKRDKFISHQDLVTPNLDKFHSIELKNVNHHYPSSKNNILSNVSIKINQGEIVGILGPSGSGKTTLVDIIIGLLSIHSGEILVNNVTSKGNTNLGPYSSYIPQQPILIDGSIKNNIALGEDSEKINEKKIEDSIDRASLSSLIKELPDGINTFIGEDGIKLSGGQRQRISIARALYFDKQILILDEATSALDKDTENAIAEEILKLKGRVTIIIITHRESMTTHCNKIFRVENGDIKSVRNL